MAGRRRPACGWPPRDLLAAAAAHLRDIAEPNTYGPTNTRGCSPTASNRSPATAATIDVRRLSDGRAGEVYAAEDPAHPRACMELLFLRFATLSSSGLSDVVPIRALARGLVRLDQLAGVGDVAMVVSRLTAMRVAYRRGP